MLEAGREAWKNGLNSDIPSTLVRHILEAAIRWQSEEAKGPTDKQFGEMVKDCGDANPSNKWESFAEWNRAIILCGEWERRMYLVPEPEMIGEDTISEFCSRYQQTEKAILEAYRRGKKDGAK